MFHGECRRNYKQDLMVVSVNILNICQIKKENNWEEIKIKYGYQIVYKIKQDLLLL